MELTAKQLAEVLKLKAMAEANYEADHGEMSECWDDEDYEDAILKDGTAEKAWEWHMRIVEAKLESCAYYEVVELKEAEAKAAIKARFPATDEGIQDAEAYYEACEDRGRNVNHFWPEAGPHGLPANADCCEFGEMEYQWHLCQAGM